MDDWNWRPPVALAADQPVAQPIGGGALTSARLLYRGNRLLKRGGPGCATPLTAIHRNGGAITLICIRKLHRIGCSGEFGWSDNGADRQAEALRKFVVALVMCGDRHDRASAVAGEDVIGDPDRDLLTVHRIHRKRASGNTTLLL